MILAFVLAATLQTSASPSPEPAPSASPVATPVPKFDLAVHGSNVFIDQSTYGPGITPPEGPGFAKGSPFSPMSPYDWFSGAPVTPGVTGVAQYLLSGTYHTGAVKLEATFGLAAVTGSTTNAAYWGEPLLPNINPHDLARTLPYSIVFPTHAGSDDATVFNASLLEASIAANDDSWRVRGGYFDLAQTDRFVFAPPALTSDTPSLGVQTAETLGPGMPSIDAWSAAPTSLPLFGADGVIKYQSATFEVTDALLPGLPNTSARLEMGSLVLDHGDAGRYSFQLAHINTSGDPILTTTLYGVQPVLDITPQGVLPTSVLANQEQTVAGARAFFHPGKGWDTLAELGRAWYDAGLVAHPGTTQPGNYVHVLLGRHLGSDYVTAEFFHFDPRYATVILPYGIPENIWSVAWSWPGVWLKSTFQMVDNTTIGANREGFRLHYDENGKHLEAHATFGSYRQLVPETVANATQVGFVDGFFLPQANGFGTIGTDQQAGLYVAWHMLRDDLVFDGVDDFLYRGVFAGHTLGYVNIRAPQIVLSLQHHFSKRVLAVAGYGRYAANGTWSITPVDAIWGAGFAGVQFATGPSTALMVEARRYGLVGLPSVGGGLPPDMRGTSLVVDQRIGL
jgi:hypothetical protein